VTIPNSVTSIGGGAFTSCTGLTSVTIGNSVTSIGYSAFLNCPNLLTIYIKGNAPTLGTTVFTANSKSNVYYRLGTTGWTSTYGGLSTVVLGLPTITGQPSSVIANPGENAAFSVIAKTTFPLTLSYQWQRNGLVIPNATEDSLYLNNIQPANVGTYTVIISNDIGSVSSTVTLTLTQGTLYTQAQYDAALQAGLNAGMAVGMTTGRAQVTDSPNSYGLYSLSQVQALHVGTPLLAKDPASGKFKLTVGVERSTNLVDFSPMAIPAGAATINAQGRMEFEFTAPDHAAFYRLRSR
jgi:BspA type Leucine rich repeat region (6 copies)/Immunoglobulin domain